MIFEKASKSCCLLYKPLHDLRGNTPAILNLSCFRLDSFPIHSTIKYTHYKEEFWIWISYSFILQARFSPWLKHIMQCSKTIMTIDSYETMYLLFRCHEKNSWTQKVKITGTIYFYIIWIFISFCLSMIALSNTV